MEMRRRKVPTQVLPSDVKMGEIFTYKSIRYRCTSTPEKSLNPAYTKIFVRRFVVVRTWVFIHGADTVSVTR
jgi:hypothetical protein